MNNCDPGLKNMLPTACGHGVHFQDLANSFSLHGPPSRHDVDEDDDDDDDDDDDADDDDDKDDDILTFRV